MSFSLSIGFIGGVLILLGIYFTRGIWKSTGEVINSGLRIAENKVKTYEIKEKLKDTKELKKTMQNNDMKIEDVNALLEELSNK